MTAFTDSSSVQAVAHPTSSAVALHELPLDYAQLVRRCMGKVELADRLLNSFEQRFPLELAEIESCLTAGDVVRLTRLMHQLKGTVANVSANVLHTIVSHLEEVARAGRFADVETGLAEVRSAWVEFKNYKSALPRAAAPSPLTRQGSSK